jgi:predicted GNAT family N-acyltransferase
MDSDLEPVAVVYELTELQIEQLHALYGREWWTRDRTLAATRRCVRGSQVCVGLVDPAGNLLAFARAITDFTFKALIFDVIVASAARQRGLGDRLLELITGHEQLRGVRHFELYCLPELFAFYARHGFSEDVGAVRLMRLVNA